ncbi:MAG: hypothetical protein HC779_04240 [Phyllobacteriaceae bacterium]|nr:hypothetical protein [Phyllobacteriaceae bacterium]
MASIRVIFGLAYIVASPDVPHALFALGNQRQFGVRQHGAALKFGVETGQHGNFFLRVICAVSPTGTTLILG